MRRLVNLLFAVGAVIAIALYTYVATTTAEGLCLLNQRESVSIR